MEDKCVFTIHLFCDRNKCGSNDKFVFSKYNNHFIPTGIIFSSSGICIWHMYNVFVIYTYTSNNYFTFYENGRRLYEKIETIYQNIYL